MNPVKSITFTGVGMFSFRSKRRILLSRWFSQVVLWLRPFIAPQHSCLSRPSENRPLLFPVRALLSPVALPPLRPAACFCLSVALNVPSSYLRIIGSRGHLLMNLSVIERFKCKRLSPQFVSRRGTEHSLP